MIVKIPDSKSSLWSISLIIGLIFSLVLKRITGGVAMSSMLFILLYCLLSVVILTEKGMKFDFCKNKKIIICIGGLGISCLIMEAVSQIRGSWPSVFWPELVIIGLTYSIMGAFERGKYVDLATIVVITSALIHSLVIAIDQYQSISDLGFVRIAIWVSLFAVLAILQSNLEEVLNVGALLGSAIGFGIYAGMVTGKIRLVGGSFSIPNEILALVFAYVVIIWPWQIICMSNYEKYGSSISQKIGQ